jgi:hypothetical protein
MAFSRLFPGCMDPAGCTCLFSLFFSFHILFVSYQPNFFFFCKSPSPSIYCLPSLTSPLPSVMVVFSSSVSCHVQSAHRLPCKTPTTDTGCNMILVCSCCNGTPPYAMVSAAAACSSIFASLFPRCQRMPTHLSRLRCQILAYWLPFAFLASVAAGWFRHKIIQYLSYSGRLLFVSHFFLYLVVHLHPGHSQDYLFVCIPLEI